MINLNYDYDVYGTCNLGFLHDLAAIFDAYRSKICKIFIKFIILIAFLNGTRFIGAALKFLKLLGNF